MLAFSYRINVQGLMGKPRLLDLFCGAGGAAMGYHRAGFEVVGVDIKPQPNYPFEFHQSDALEFCMTHGHCFDAIHASPPCQGYSSANRKHYKEWPKLIPPLRALLRRHRVWAIENVEGAAREMTGAIVVCGGALGLRTRRHRLFLSPMLLFGTHHHHTRQQVPIYGKLDGRRLWSRKDGTELRAARHLADAQDAMGIDWMTWEELREAIPPVYTEFIGKQLLQHLQRNAA